MATVLCVLYDDPVDGYPPSYARGEVPTGERYPDGRSTPTPQALGFTPGGPPTRPPSGSPRRRS
jgi:formate dehydrogenase